ncbi:MAG: M20/M25/M40 family metallo-hydrolase [Phycisphaerae bacterium]|nr:M20/M25/M40 family metallo-hydrolase [Phycisphaerae bacterium]
MSDHTTSPPPEPATLRGFSSARCVEQRELERKIIDQADPATIAEHSRTLATRPHVAGTEAQVRTRDYVIERMVAWGLQTSVTEHSVYLPHVTRLELRSLTPREETLDLLEPALPGDPSSHPSLPLLAECGYAAAGDVSGPLVYVNYGRPGDLDQLAARGIDLNGCVAIARYGEIFRGLKVRNVQQRGAIACLLYCDPHDDGYYRGDVYPEGPMRPEFGIQRGSLGWGPPGDTREPGLSTDLPSIPTIPIRADVAAKLLNQVSGVDVPQDWQGALPFRYHIGPGPARVRVSVAHDGATRPIWNTLGQITGSDFPDECIVIGAHRDAWGPGATDNVSGVVSVMEAARLCASLAGHGHAPRRTLIFATWDAEEWGIVGSTEWAMANRVRLSRGLVAYLNQDVAACGPNFSVAASPTLTELLLDVMRNVPTPDDESRSVHDAWQALPDHDPRIRVPGGGSDHETFLFHLGVPAAGFGFGGPGGVYHSIYDSTAWLERFGDPGYRRHRAAAQLTALTALRLANADVHPYNLNGYADALSPTIDDLKRRLAEADRPVPPAIGALELDAFTQAANELNTVLRRETLANLPPTALTKLNAELRATERSFLRDTDMPASTDAGFYRHTLFGVAPDSGYAARPLPGVQAAIDAGDQAAVATEIELITTHIASATEHLRAATGVVPR